MNIDMNKKDMEGFELYRAFSEVNDSFVDEMLDDDLAESIRAANKRKRISIRGAFAAAAAVVVLVVGVGIIPRGGLRTNETADKQSIMIGDNRKGDMAAAQNSGGDTVTAEAEKSDNIAEYADNAEEEQPAAAAPEEYKDGGADGNAYAEEQRAEEAAEEAPAEDRSEEPKPAEGVSGGKEQKKADEQQFAAAAETTDEAPPDNAAAEQAQDEDEEENDADDDDGEESNGTAAAAFDKVILPDGAEYTLAEKVSENHRGKPIGENERFAAYGFDNFPTETMITVEVGGEYYAAMRSNLQPETLADLYEGFDLARYLKCDDESFTQSVWDKLFTAPAKSPRTDPASPDPKGSVYNCRLGTDSETFVDGVTITLRTDGTTEFSALGMTERFITG